MAELFQIPNLVSLSRVVLAPVIAYFLYLDTATATLVAGVLIVVAGITDGLDGYLARRRGEVSRLGIALDPICDKLFAVILVLALIRFRDFPLWLTAVIILRDLLIMVGGLYLRRDRAVDLPSNLTGKYAFAALAVLLAAHVIRFEFSITIMTPLTVILLAVSLANYARVFLAVRRGQSPPPFEDSAGWRLFRYGLLGVVALAHIVMFYFEFLA